MPHTLIAVLMMFALFPSLAQAVPITGEVEITTPFDRYMALKMDITDTTTTFEMTGPDFSWFSFGFDTTSMNGYSFIIEGLDGTRTAHERNLVANGNPGSPQATQNISIVSTVHDAVNDLTTITISRANHTGDPDDPDFFTSMTTLDVIWAYRAAASPGSPAPALNYHGSSGRGSTVITFSPVPEPCSLLLFATMSTKILSSRRTR